MRMRSGQVPLFVRTSPFIALVLGLAPAIAYAEPPAITDDEQAIERLADEMLKPFDRKRAPAPLVYGYAFASYALTNMGMEDPAFAAKAARLVDRLVDRVLDPALSRGFDAGFVTVEGHRISKSMALRGHLALMLAGRSRLSARMDEGHERLLRTVVDGLANDIEASPNHLLPSYGQRAWPADNEVARAALAIDAHKIRTAEALASMKRTLDAIEKSGGHDLPPSELRLGTLKTKDVPRGCALSWTVIMRGLWDRDSAVDLYRRYRRAYWVDHTLVQGFREWPPGVDRKGDFDSGPIILGIGVAASGFGLGAAKIVGATEDYDTLARSSKIAGLPLIESIDGSKTHLMRAIALYARTARSWRLPDV
jgi:hypothetical protein